MKGFIEVYDQRTQFLKDIFLVPLKISNNYLTNKKSL